MKVSKKVMSIALCTALLSGGYLASLANVSNAASVNNEMSTRTTQKDWKQALNLNLRIQRKLGTGKANLQLKLENKNGKVKLELVKDSTIPRDVHDYKFADEYVFGVKSNRNGKTTEGYFKFIDCQYKCNTLCLCCSKNLCRCFISKTLARSIIYYI